MDQNSYSTTQPSDNPQPRRATVIMQKSPLPSSYRTLLIIALVFSSIALGGLVLITLPLLVASSFIGTFDSLIKTSTASTFITALWVVIVYTLVIALILVILTSLELKRKNAKSFVAINVFLWLSLSLVMWIIAILMLAIALHDVRDFQQSPPSP